MGISFIVIGALNTDIIAAGVERFPQPGEHVYGRELKIGPGGKSRNIAQMIAYLAGRDRVVMVGRTAKDSYGLWRVPVDALHQAGVNTKYLKTQSGNLFPGVALIPVDEHGRNQIFVLPGASNDFSPADIDDATTAFTMASKNNGILLVTLECPFPTAIHAMKKAAALGLRILLDPGGIKSAIDGRALVPTELFLIKPNEHEAKILTGVEVTDFATAGRAARVLQSYGIKNVLITAGALGGYLFTDQVRKHIPAPLTATTSANDETGCGDQTIAAFGAYIHRGRSVEEAAELGIIAGTLQFQTIGINPVKREEIEGVYSRRA